MQNSDKVKRDWFFSNSFIPIAKPILANALTSINIASLEQDMREATDLVVLKNDQHTIGMRIRRSKFYFDEKDGYKFKDQFTIRYDRPSGVQTEFYKMIMEGFCDYYFYGISNEKNDGFGLWKYVILDLSVFRREVKQYVNENGELISYGLCMCLRGSKPPFTFSFEHNGDGSSDFIAFVTHSFSKDLIIEEKDMKE